ncbi:hypothetical protein L218DRAFT_879783 [Marasmius fiardii PR-910]|nr:hypothetical protein L218DRAFT_879783 [Marasmius fiardii PR-910]
MSCFHLQYVLAGAGVFWRAWVLYSMDYKRLLYVPFFFLCCAASECRPMLHFRTSSKSLTRAIDICQVSNLASSLLMNILATGVKGLKAWQFRMWIKLDLEAVGEHKTRGEKILLLLIESGSLYCFSGVRCRFRDSKLQHAAFTDFFFFSNRSQRWCFL